ncbi:MAG TPA: dihydroorotate dehydrogenase-like protein [Anaerolineaceae bacterium]
MVDLSTTYLGMKLENPIVAAASPLSKKIDGIRRLEDAGASAVVMYSLFEEQIVHESLALDYYLNQGTYSNPEAITYYPDLKTYNMGPDSYLEHIAKAKKAVQIPIIGSLNGMSMGGWVEYARKIEQAGADALELNTYFLSTDPTHTSAQVEQVTIDLVKEVAKQIRIPLSVKLSPFFASLPNFADQLVKAGAKGLVLFNRFIQPDLDIEALEVVPHLELSTSAELRLPLRWVAILAGRIGCDLALTSGVHTVQDVVKSIMAGANVTMLASELLAHGIGRITDLNRDLDTWMVKNEYTSVKQMLGSMSQKSVADPAAFERANYMKTLTSYDNRTLY